MKNLKRLVAIALSVVMICALSTVAFADEIAQANAQFYALTIKPATITQGTTTFSVDFVLTDTRATDKTIDIVGSSSNTMNSFFGLKVDDAASTAGVKIVSVTSAAANVVQWENTGSQYMGELQLLNAVSLSATQPVLTVNFEVPANIAKGDYSIKASDNDYRLTLWDKGAASGNIGSKDWAATKILTVNEAVQFTPAEWSGGTTVTMAPFTANDGTKYKNVWTSEYTVVANDDTINGVKLVFTGSHASAQHTYEIKSAALAGVSGPGGATFKVAVVGAPEEARADLNLIKQ